MSANKGYKSFKVLVIEQEPVEDAEPMAVDEPTTTQEPVAITADVDGPVSPEIIAQVAEAAAEQLEKETGVNGETVEQTVTITADADGNITTETEQTAVPMDTTDVSLLFWW